MIANGHSEAAAYPIPLLWEQSQFVVERNNIELANYAIAVQMAGTSIMGGRKAGKTFQKWLDRLIDG